MNGVTLRRAQGDRFAVHQVLEVRDRRLAAGLFTLTLDA